MHSGHEQSIEKVVLRQCGAVLATRRHALKLKQAEVAVAIGLKVGTLSRLENGKQWVRMEILVRLALLFDLEVAELFPPLVDSLSHQVCVLLRRSHPDLQAACHTMLTAALKANTKGGVAHKIPLAQHVGMLHTQRCECRRGNTTEISLTG